MTAKRDFKRRVRQRQARTGESYVTARRHVVAGRPKAERTPSEKRAEAETAPEASGTLEVAGLVESAAAALDVDSSVDSGAAARPEPTGATSADAGPSGISVIELIDVSEQARSFGLMCRVLMFPDLIRRIDPSRVLGRLRDLLIAMVDDREVAVLVGLLLTGSKPARHQQGMYSYHDLGQFLARARAGLGGVFDDGSTLAFHVADRDGMIPILCALSANETAIELSAIEDLPTRWNPIDTILRSSPGAARTRSSPRVVSAARQLETLVADYLSSRMPSLFVIHAQQRTPITKDEFVIGRTRATADLAIFDPKIAHRHAVVIRKASGYFVGDLGSEHGVRYKGVRIGHKRIDEGDVFQLGDHEITFTFRAE